MSHSVGVEAAQGINWSIERGLVDADVAAAASREILEAIATGDKMIKFDFAEPEHGFTGYRVRGLEKPSTDFPALFEVRAALEPFKDPALLKEVGAGHYDEGFVNVTRAKGRVALHSDSEPWSLVFVNLAADVKARIKHRDEARFTKEVLHPGDAICITNPKAKKQRPKHELINLSDFARISYGEYTTQRRR